MVVLTHLCEALGLFPWMHWGLEDSFGHYLDLSSAVLGLTLFPIGTCSTLLQSDRGEEQTRGAEASVNLPAGTQATA